MPSYVLRPTHRFLAIARNDNHRNTCHSEQQRGIFTYVTTYVVHRTDSSLSLGMTNTETPVIPSSSEESLPMSPHVLRPAHRFLANARNDNHRNICHSEQQRGIFTDAITCFVQRTDSSLSLGMTITETPVIPSSSEESLPMSPRTSSNAQILPYRSE